MEGEEFVKHFQYLGNILSYICCFIYSREVSKSPIGHHSYYKWSKALFVLNLFVHCILYIYTYYNFSNNFKVEINNLTKFIVFSTYVGLRFVFAFLERDPFTDLIFEIEMYDLQKQVLFYQHKSLHNKSYGKQVVSTLLFIIILVLFYYIFGVFFSYTNAKILEHIILFIAIIILSMSSLPFTVLFVYFAHEIFLRYKSLHTFFINELNSVNKHCHEQFLDNYRLLFFQLSRAQYKFTICFGSGITIFYCYTYFLLLCYMRDALVTYHYPLILFLIVKVFLEMCLIASVAGNISKESNSMLTELCCLPTSNLSVRSQNQVYLFILQIQISDQGISAVNHFEVNKTTIISMATCVTAYFPLLISIITYTL